MLRLFFLCILLPVMVSGSARPVAAQADSVFDIGRTDRFTVTHPAEVADEPPGFPEPGADPGRVIDAARSLAYRPLHADELVRGITDQMYWLRFRVRNSSASPQTWLLHGDISYLDHLDVYYRSRSGPDDGGVFERIRLSDRRPYGDRPVSYRKLTFRHETGPGEITEIYLRTGYEVADSLSLHFTVTREERFFAAVQRENLAFGAWYGTMMVLLLIALLIALSLRQLSALYYAGFIASTMLMWALLNGLGYQFLWPDSTSLQNEGFHLSFLLFSFFAFQFSRSFLHLSRFFPGINRLMLAAQAGMLLSAGLRFAGLYEPVLYLSYFF